MSTPKTILCCKRSSNAVRSFQAYGFAEASSQQQADMLWVRKGYEPLLRQLQDFQLINHFANEPALINKGYLTSVLKRYEANRIDQSISMHDFYPETYYLDDPEERWLFSMRQPKVDHSDNVWIYKPGGDSRGRGIQLIWQTRKLMENGFYPPGAARDRTGVIQRYLRDPLLIENRKFDIRVYWLLASVKPLRVLIYPEAKVRLAGGSYEQGNLDNQSVHLTNYALQKTHPDFDDSLRYKWFLSELDDYLFEQKITSDRSISKSKLMPQIMRCLEHVVRAGEFVLSKNYPKKGDCFGVFGADFLVDRQFNVKLTEIQKGPGLRMGDRVEQDIIPHMLGQAAAIALSLRDARIDGDNLSTPADIGNYQWVIDDVNNPVEFSFFKKSSQSQHVQHQPHASENESLEPV